MSGDIEQAAIDAVANTPIADLIDVHKIDTDVILGFVTAYGVKLLAAAAIFFIGKWMVRRIVNVVKRMMSRGSIDSTLIGFVGNIMFSLGMAFVIIAVLAQVGIETTSLAAVIAAAGLAIGLALQGSLSNFAAGFLIILFKFFKKGDYIEVAGTAGSVEDISIFTTTLKTPDNRMVIVPNSSITTGTIVNYSANNTRRIDLVIGVSYDADIKKTQDILMGIIVQDDRILQDPVPVVEVLALADSSVNFAVRPWVNTSDYWVVYFDLMKTIKIKLDEAGIGIPFPQRDVNLYIHDADGQPTSLPTNKSSKKAA